MKRIRLFKLLCLVLCAVFLSGLSGCKKSNEDLPGPIEMLIYYYIGRYIEGDMYLIYGDRSYELDPINIYVGWDITKEYRSPDLSNPNQYDERATPMEPVNTEGYLELAKHNGDRLKFPLKIPFGGNYNDNTALAYDFESIHVTSDMDWDENHPAGTPLDDLVQMSIRTFAELLTQDYFVNGGDGSEIYTKPMDEMTPDLMRVVAFREKYWWPARGGHFCIELSFPTRPTVDPGADRELTVTMTTTKGEIKQASIIYPPRGGGIVRPTGSAEQR